MGEVFSELHKHLYVTLGITYVLDPSQKTDVWEMISGLLFLDKKKMYC